MAASMSMMPETRKLTSRCSPEVDRCSHLFEIHGYTLQEGLGVGRALHSATFAVGGYEWRISYYPDGYHGELSIGYASVYIDFMSNKTCPAGTEVRGHVCFRLFNPSTGKFRIVPAACLSIEHTVEPNESNHAWGCSKFIDRIQTSPYLSHDRLTIECHLSVVVGTRVSGPESAETTCENLIIEVPCIELVTKSWEAVGDEGGGRRDIQGQRSGFPRPKVVLAARSPVFKAELFGLIGEMKTRHGHITIQDMEPGVFKALLHCIYTDSLPAANRDGCDLDDEGVVKHLLVAADRYAMDRMRLMCESMLCRRLDVENVAATLALADQHYCSKLKDACISFMSSRKRIKDVMGTQGYEHLKKAHPSIVMNLLEEFAVKSSVC